MAKTQKTVFIFFALTTKTGNGVPNIIFMEDYPVAKQTKGLSFGAAISELKEGRSVAREGWNQEIFTHQKDYSMETITASTECLNCGEKSHTTVEAIDLYLGECSLKCDICGKDTLHEITPFVDETL